MAGTAISVPAITPLISACSRIVTRRSPRSGDLDERDLAALNLIVAELAVLDVADVGGITRTARPVIVDGLLGGDGLQSVDGIVDLDAARCLADFADIVLDRGPRGVARDSDSQQHQIDLIIDLRGVRIGRRNADHLYQIAVGLRAFGG